MKNVSLLETAFALGTVDEFFGAVALEPKIDSYDELRSLIRSRMNPLPGALSTLIKYHGKYTDHDPFDPVTKYKDVGLHGKLIARIDYTGRRSPKEIVSITHIVKGLPILGSRNVQYVAFDGNEGSYDVASSDVRFGEHDYILPREPDSSDRMTRFVQIAAPLIGKFVDSIR